MTEAPKVYSAIAAVMADLAREGIAKTEKNQQQGYNFRGIDQVYNALAPVLSRHKLLVLPRVLSRTVTERVSVKEYNGQKKESVLFYVALDAEFDFVSAEDGSKHTVRTCGEAMDSGDKASNKAMSAAYKYAAMQAFCIPTEGDNDADATTHEVKAGEAHVLVKDQKETWKILKDELTACTSVEELATLWGSKPFQAELKTIKPEWRDMLIEYRDELKAGLGKPIDTRGYVPPRFDSEGERHPSEYLKA